MDSDAGCNPSARVIYLFLVIVLVGEAVSTLVFYRRQRRELSHQPREAVSTLVLNAETRRQEEAMLLGASRSARGAMFLELGI